MEIVLNGQPMMLSAPLSLAQLVEQLGFTGKRIAVERNGEIVPKSQHASCMLMALDKLEIVVAVGGG